MPSAVHHEDDLRTPTAAGGGGYIAAATPREREGFRHTDDDDVFHPGASVHPISVPTVGSDSTLPTAAAPAGPDNDQPLTSPKKKSQTTKSGAASAAAATEEQRARANFKFADLYRYASRWDLLLLAVGLVMTAINGALFPCMALIFGEAISSFQPPGDDEVERLDEERPSEMSTSLVCVARKPSQDSSEGRATPRNAAGADGGDVDGNTTKTKKKKAPKPFANFSVSKALALCRPERKFFLFGCLGAAVVGCSMPGSAILISGMVSSMTDKYMRFQATEDRPTPHTKTSTMTLEGIAEYSTLNILARMDTFDERYDECSFGERTSLRLVHLR
ncbi:hypothetical protein PybrP1_000385 [[Pythium] brassicae (nom. inval.)]|nr:hypothetical protein PybrP1_000385 [[Pythium] brassicae (nom. inval.)]